MNKDYSLFYKIEYQGKNYLYDPYGINPYVYSMGVWRIETVSGKGGQIANKQMQETLNTIHFQRPRLPDMFERFMSASGQERKRLETLSLTWLQLKVKGIKTGANLEFVKTSRNFLPGKLYFYIYDAKGKDVLPIWDAFPLVLVIELYNTGFLGLNFHYLKVEDRIKLMENLMQHYGKYDISRDRGFAQEREISTTLNWKDILSIKDKSLVKPCIKRYLFDHVKSRIVPLESHEWAYSIFLPAQDFRKKNQNVRTPNN